MSDLLAIDPGTENSAWVQFDAAKRIILGHGKEQNYFLLSRLSDEFEHVVIEQVQSYGKPVGQEVFTTVWWCGRFWEHAVNAGSCCVHVPRRDVKMHLCGTIKGINDAVIRQRLIDLFGPGREKAIGTKKNQGPLYGLKADEWQALAIAVTFAETKHNTKG